MESVFIFHILREAGLAFGISVVIFCNVTSCHKRSIITISNISLSNRFKSNRINEEGTDRLRRL